MKRKPRITAKEWVIIQQALYICGGEFNGVIFPEMPNHKLFNMYDKLIDKVEERMAGEG